jgi:mevalonate kinase
VGPDPHTSTNSIASKIMILGEYAVLQGAPALMAAIAPRFQFDTRDPENLKFHPASPAGRWSEGKNLKGRFIDPFSDEGGFGGSTAELALLLYSQGIHSLKDALAIYRGLTDQGQTFPPSGVDFAIQWRGGAAWVSADSLVFADVAESLAQFHVLIFTGTHLLGRKIKTHEHLKNLKTDASEFEKLFPVLDLAKQSLTDGNAIHFGESLSLYADLLSEMGLEVSGAKDDRKTVSEIPGVLGAKGCGAGLSDSMIVVCESEDVFDTAIECLEGRGLRLVSRGLQLESGIR